MQVTVTPGEGQAGSRQKHFAAVLTTLEAGIMDLARLANAAELIAQKLGLYPETPTAIEPVNKEPADVNAQSVLKRLQNVSGSLRGITSRIENNLGAVVRELP